jgi:hypothetical protein
MEEFFSFYHRRLTVEIWLVGGDSPGKMVSGSKLVPRGSLFGGQTGRELTKVVGQQWVFGGRGGDGGSSDRRSSVT